MSKSLEAGFTDLAQFLESHTLPDSDVAALHSMTRSGDGETVLVMVELEDGATAALHICPGAPRFESQASFLRRHKLLTPGEERALRAKDFAPEALPRDLWPLTAEEMRDA